MLSSVVKVAAVTASSAIVLPYIAALICNLAYGWPQVPNRYRRAFHPRKVFALNLTIIQSLMVSLRYAALFVQWKAYYKKAQAPEVIKDKEYGRRNKKLDLYIPNKGSTGDSEPCPVVVFAYGGAWGSGDKKMYGLLCSAIANKLNVIVCCPNHSTYPQEKIMMLGHSSGAHLSMMTILKLCSEVGTQPPSPGSLSFMEKHFNGNSDNNDIGSYGSSGSFQVVDSQNGNGVQTNGTDKMSMSSSQFEVLQTQKSETEVSEGSLLDSEIQELTLTENTGIRYRGTSQAGKQSALDEVGANDGERREKTDDGSGDVDLSSFLNQSVEQSLTIIQPSMPELMKSVKALIGIAGVYHIGDHFKHESSRGVEDISTMAKAMRGTENFERFSPTHIASTLTTAECLPKIVLLHGTEDYVVPLSSTTKLVDELKRIEADVILRIIPNCDHYEICLDLMKPTRNFHTTVMNIIEDTANSVFS